MSDAKIERIELETIRAHARIDVVEKQAKQNREQLIEISGRAGTNGKIGEFRRDLRDVRADASDAKADAAAAAATAKAEAELVADATAKERAELAEQFGAEITEVRERVAGLEKIGRKVILAGTGVGGAVATIAEIIRRFM